MEEKQEKQAEELAEVTKEIEGIASGIDGHVHSDSCTHTTSRGESEPQPFKKSIAEMEEEQAPTITIKDFKALKRSGYEKIADKFQYAYVIRNKKTGVVVEIRAASSVHACNIIGWRPKNTQLIEVIDTKKKENAEKVGKEDVITAEVTNPVA